MITEWNIWNTQQFCQKYFEHRHRGLGVSFWYSPSLLSSGFGQPSGYSCVPQTLYKKEQSKDFDGKFLFLQSLTSLFIATWFPLHKTSVPPSFDTIEECITLEWANDVSIYQTNKRIHVMENWKMLAYKIKDLNMNPVRGPEIKILACPSKGLIWCPIWCPAVWLPIYNNVAEITRQLLCWWSLIWSSQRNLTKEEEWKHLQHPSSSLVAAVNHLKNARHNLEADSLSCILTAWNVDL